MVKTKTCLLIGGTGFVGSALTLEADARGWEVTSVGREEWPRYDPSDPHQMVFDRPSSGVQDCPPEKGLDLMRDRIAYLSDVAAD